MSELERYLAANGFSTDFTPAEFHGMASLRSQSLPGRRLPARRLGQHHHEGGLMTEHGGPGATSSPARRADQWREMPSPRTVAPSAPFLSVLSPGHSNLPLRSSLDDLPQAPAAAPAGASLYSPRRRASAATQLPPLAVGSARDTRRHSLPASLALRAFAVPHEAGDEASEEDVLAYDGRVKENAPCFRKTAQHSS